MSNSNSNSTPVVEGEVLKGLAVAIPLAIVGFWLPVGAAVAYLI